MTIYRNIAFIGAGNMAAAIVGGLIAEGYPAEKIFVSNRNFEKLASFAKLGVQTMADNVKALMLADVVILAVKPQHLKPLCDELKTDLMKKPMSVIVSIAPGVSCDMLSTWLGKSYPVVRVMPNTPALVRAGASGLFANNEVNQDERNFVETLFRSVGLVVWVDNESQLAAVTAVSGSGPAYFFLFMEAMQECAEALGLSSQDAKLLTQQTAFGAAKLAFESEQPLAALRRSVTSQQGTTASAIKIFEKRHLSDIVSKAMTAAEQRAIAIMQELNKS